MKTFEGKLVSQNIKIGIVAARFNEFITSKPVSYTHLLSQLFHQLQKIHMTAMLFQPALVATKREIMSNLPTQHKLGILQGLSLIHILLTAMRKALTFLNCPPTIRASPC